MEQVSKAAQLREHFLLMAELREKTRELQVQLAKSVKKELFPGLSATPSPSGEDLYVDKYKGACILKGGGWGEQDPDDALGYGRPHSNPPPLSWEEFDQQVQLLAEKLDLVIQYETLDVRIEGGIETVSALRMLHPGKEIVLTNNGKVWHTGWDIPDEYYQVTIDGEEWVFWSSNGHGFGIEHAAKFGTPEWQNFEDFRTA